MDETHMVFISGTMSAGAWTATLSLRWFAESAHHPCRLQQAWQELGTGRIEWHEVPTEFADPRAEQKDGK